MPELPEVETIKRSLQKSVVGKKITGVEVLLAKQFQGKKEDVAGEKITSIERRGKILKISLSNGKNLLIHFKLTGQLVWKGHPAKTTHVIFNIDGGQLFFNDLRQFGWIKVVDEAGVAKEIGKLGIEPFDKGFTADYLKQIFSKTSKPIKLVLMEQEKIAGIGNIYANDALFEAGIIPTRPSKSLKDEEINKLRNSIIRVLEDGLKYGGSSAADEAYIKPSGEKGEYQKHFRVYQRDGQKCLKCGGIIKRIKIAGRGTFFCSNCQK